MLCCMVVCFLNFGRRANIKLQLHCFTFIDNNQFESVIEAVTMYLPLMQSEFLILDSSSDPYLKDVKADFVRWNSHWDNLPKADRTAECLHW